MAQTYYDILGVSPTADDFVIRAAYKALAQRYHPDKFQGNAQEAEQKTRDINEAYDVLSNESRRRAYDASLKTTEQNQPKNEQAAKQQEDWAIALRFYPDLKELEGNLTKIDPVLVLEFKKMLLTSQDYNNRHNLASQLEQSYLEDYFGNDRLIIGFARELLMAGKRDGAKELNQMLKVVGRTVPAEEIIEQIKKSYFTANKYSTSTQGGSYNNKARPDVSSFDSEAEWKKIQDQANREFKDADEKNKRAEAVKNMRRSWGLSD